MPQAQVPINWEILRKLLQWPDDARLQAVGMLPYDVLMLVIESDSIPPDAPRVQATYRTRETSGKHRYAADADFVGFQVPGADVDATNE